MKVKRLYIIGNGFDIWHGLPTSYNNFYDFAEKTLDEISDYYLLDFSTDQPWCDFENSLGKFDWKAFYSENNHIDPNDEDFRPSFAFCLEDDVSAQADLHVDEVRECFQNWIEDIDISAATARLAISKNALFLCFNYTSTLEYEYGIDVDKILYIHGKAGGLDELVFGHGEVIEEESEFDEYGDSNRTMFSDAEEAAKYPLYAFKKQVSDILEKNKSFFSNLISVKEIIIIGHSLNKIDLPYIKEIASVALNAKWMVCLYRSEEAAEYMEKLVSGGVVQGKINFCTYEDLCIN